MTLTRRAFLQIFGLTAAGAVLPSPVFAGGTGWDVPAAAVTGRVLWPTPLYNGPSTSTGFGATLWADTLVNIRQRRAAWYETECGWLPVEVVQPVLPQPTVTQPEPALPFDAQVTGAVAAVRAYCDPHAPLTARIGNGGIMRVGDALDYPQTGRWYQLAGADGTALGWAQAAASQPYNPTHNRLTLSGLSLDRTSSTLQAGGAFSTRVNLPADLPAGRYTVERLILGGGRLAQAGGVQHGVPYTLQLATGHRMHAVMWHNRFGRQAAHIELNVPTAAAIWQTAPVEINIT